MDCSPSGSSVHGILQARILEWVAIPFSRVSSLPRDWTQISCIAGGLFTTWATKTSSYWFKFFGRDDMVQRQWIWSACVHICVFVSTYIRSYECMCIYVYTCVCVCMRERERARELSVCGWVVLMAFTRKTCQRAEIGALAYNIGPAIFGSYYLFFPLHIPLYLFWSKPTVETISTFPHIPCFSLSLREKWEIKINSKE